MCLVPEILHVGSDQHLAQPREVTVVLILHLHTGHKQSINISSSHVKTQWFSFSTNIGTLAINQHLAKQREVTVVLILHIHTGHRQSINISLIIQSTSTSWQDNNRFLQHTTHLYYSPGVLPGPDILVADLHQLIAAHHSKGQVGVHLLQKTKIIHLCFLEEKNLVAKSGQKPTAIKNKKNSKQVPRFH